MLRAIRCGALACRSHAAARPLSHAHAPNMPQSLAAAALRVGCGYARTPQTAVVARRLCTVAAANTGAATASGGMVGALLGFARRRPYATNIIVATLKTALCDVIVQRFVERRETIDWKRNAVFWVFGFAYLGCFQWFIYVTLFKRLWPGMELFAHQPLRAKLSNGAGIRALFGQVAFDNFVHYPFIYFPFFYFFKEMIQGEQSSADSATSSSGALHAARSIGVVGFSKYRDNAVEDNLKMWALWVPGDLLIYSVPLWMRLPLNHGISFAWTCYLSFLRGDSINDASDEEVPPARTRA